MTHFDNLEDKISTANTNTNTNTTASLSVSPWLIWGMGAFFFFAEYYARVAPGVMAPELMRHFQVNAFALGALSACFYYAYIFMQLPVGMMMDRYGPHRLLTGTALICAMGGFVFAFAPNIGVAQFGRVLMGFGAAFAFVGSLKLASIWFPARRFGLMAGLTQAIGMLGAFTGEGPMALVVTHIGWVDTMLLISVGFVLLGIAIAIFVRDTPAGHPHTMRKNAHQVGLLSSLKRVLKNRASWLNGLYVGLLYAPTAAFAELWGVEFLQHVYHIQSRVLAAAAVGMIFLGWGVGGPLAGWFSDKIGRRKPLMIGSALCGFIILTSVLYIQLPLPMVYLLLFLYGLTNSGVVIAYALSSEINSRSISGTSMAFANMASVIVGAAFQPIIGWLLVHHATKHLIVHGAPVYSSGDYRSAMIVLPICLFLSLISTCWIRETYCKGVE